MLLLNIFHISSLNGKDFMSLGFPPSYSNFPMRHRNDKLLTVRIILIFKLIPCMLFVVHIIPNTVVHISSVIMQVIDSMSVVHNITCAGLLDT